MADKLNDELKFYEWDDDNRVVTEYRRLGECNQCGDCCRALIKLMAAGLHPTKESVKAGGTTTTGKGVWNEVRRGNLRRFFRTTHIGEIGSNVCESLAEDNSCNVQFNKSLYNKTWPLAPSQVTPFPRCSYDFEVIGQWGYAEVGQPEG